MLNLSCKFVKNDSNINLKHENIEPKGIESSCYPKNDLYSHENILSKICNAIMTQLSVISRACTYHALVFREFFTLIALPALSINRKTAIHQDFWYLIIS